MEQATHVSILDDGIGRVADEIVSEYDLEYASWDAPVYLRPSEHGIEDTVDFIVVGNALNYCFNDLETGEKFRLAHDGTEWRGAFGMWAGLRQAYDTGIPILDPAFLQQIDRETVEELFEPIGVPIPMLKSRVEQLQHVGSLLADRGESFASLFTGEVALYGETGVIERLGETAAFSDSAECRGQHVPFYKRAQLTVSMLYGKLLGTTHAFDIVDMDAFTIFPDYGIPAGLRACDALQYSEELADRVDRQHRIPAGSDMEVEIRAATVVAGDEIKAVLEDEYGVDVTVPKLDYALWQLRSSAETKQHLTETTAY